MKPHEFVKLAAIVLTGPVVAVVAIVLYERGVAEDTMGLIAGVGWTAGGIAAVWATARVLRQSPRKYAKWAVLGSIPAAVVAVILHNVAYAITGAEEPFFFLVALVVAPIVFIGGLIALAWPEHHPPSGRGLQPG